MIKDLKNIRSVSGLFAGFLPFTINYVRLYVDYFVYKKEDGLYEAQTYRGLSSLLPSPS
jgi:hypothetical protein